MTSPRVVLLNFRWLRVVVRPLCQVREISRQILYKTNLYCQAEKGINVFFGWEGKVVFLTLNRKFRNAGRPILWPFSRFASLRQNRS
jgi:hypothetical protein